MQSAIMRIQVVVRPAALIGTGYGATYHTETASWRTEMWEGDGRLVETDINHDAEGDWEVTGMDTLRSERADIQRADRDGATLVIHAWGVERARVAS